MSKLTDVIASIIELGEENGWFEINITGLTPYDFIEAEGSVIKIDTSCIKAFREATEDTSLDQLEEYLREMIEAHIPNASDFQIIIEIKDEDNYL